jgi:hypothetical protein
MKEFLSDTFISESVHNLRVHGPTLLNNLQKSLYTDPATWWINLQVNPRLSSHPEMTKNNQHKVTVTTVNGYYRH